MALTAPKERPILFSSPMIRAILDGRKSMTRRVVKPQPTHRLVEGLGGVTIGMDPALDGAVWYGADGINPGREVRCPYGRPGDLLWVREAWRTCPGTYVPGVEFADGVQRFPEFEDLDSLPRDWMNHDRKRPSIHMPKWACRLWLRVTDVRVHRVQEISEDDARAEGVFGPPESQAGWRQYPYESCHLESARDSFRSLWESINGKRPGCSWADDPWVWAVTFARTEAPR